MIDKISRWLSGMYVDNTIQEIQMIVSVVKHL